MMSISATAHTIPSRMIVQFHDAPTHSYVFADFPQDIASARHDARASYKRCRG